jgi:hypothetical protein
MAPIFFFLYFNRCKRLVYNPYNNNPKTRIFKQEKNKTKKEQILPQYTLKMVLKTYTMSWKHNASLQYVQSCRDEEVGLSLMELVVNLLHFLNIGGGFGHPLGSMGVAQYPLGVFSTTPLDTKEPPPIFLFVCPFFLFFKKKARAK